LDLVCFQHLQDIKFSKNDIGATDGCSTRD